MLYLLIFTPILVFLIFLVTVDGDLIAAVEVMLKMMRYRLFPLPGTKKGEGRIGRKRKGGPGAGDKSKKPPPKPPSSVGKEGGPSDHNTDDSDDDEDFFDSFSQKKPRRGSSSRRSSSAGSKRQASSSFSRPVGYADQVSDDDEDEDDDGDLSPIRRGSSSSSSSSSAARVVVTPAASSRGLSGSSSSSSSASAASASVKREHDSDDSDGGVGSGRKDAKRPRGGRSSGSGGDGGDDDNRIDLTNSDDEAQPASAGDWRRRLGGIGPHALVPGHPGFDPDALYPSERVKRVQFFERVDNLRCPPNPLDKLIALLGGDGKIAGYANSQLPTTLSLIPYKIPHPSLITHIFLSLFFFVLSMQR